MTLALSPRVAVTLAGLLFIALFAVAVQSGVFWHQIIAVIMWALVCMAFWLNRSPWQSMVWSGVSGIRLKHRNGRLYRAWAVTILFRSKWVVILELKSLARSYRLMVCRYGQQDDYRHLLQRAVSADI